ncbi:MAG: rubrerythrin [candidate division Zixibacteria bacterium DG_27]|nr:MAG: rubrerythrin [candidate division Zixibacteria bacterium DG_27]
MKFKSVVEILDFAIDKEEEAAQFYKSLATKAEHWTMGKAFEDFAREEVKHKEKLLKIKEGKLLAPAVEKVKDLKIADYLVDVTPSPELDYQEALILAMKKEKASFKLYNDLATSTDDSNLRNTLLSLAQEEAKHKLRLEVEYDEHFLSEN